MKFITGIVLVCVEVCLLLIPPTSSQNQCTLPTNEDVRSVANYLYSLNNEGSPPTVQDVFQVHFICLATVAQDMYAYATLIANFTITSNSDILEQEFQLVCDGAGVWGSASNDFIDPTDSLPMLFKIETESQCAQCGGMASSTANYNPNSTCLCKWCIFVMKRVTMNIL